MSPTKQHLIVEQDGVVISEQTSIISVEDFYYDIWQTPFQRKVYTPENLQLVYYSLIFNNDIPDDVRVIHIAEGETVLNTTIKDIKKKLCNNYTPGTM